MFIARYNMIVWRRINVFINNQNLQLRELNAQQHKQIKKTYSSIHFQSMKEKTSFCETHFKESMKVCRPLCAAHRTYSIYCGGNYMWNKTG